jgi:GntR family transcriptional regulator
MMKLIIQTSSMVPIYEQIMAGIKEKIATGELQAGMALPSVRALANELKISALTVKKAYDRLEEEGLTHTVHGKGTFVAAVNPELVAEQQRQELEADMEALVTKARSYEISAEELRQMLELFLED